MFGTLRFLLAIAVMLSHLGVKYHGYNFGVASVVLFYILAGMVALKLNLHFYQNRPFLYYKDRFLRIFPLYFLVLSIAIAVYLVGANSYFLSKSPTFIDFMQNLTVVPLAYYMYSGIDHFTLVPPVWSLGVELQFYMLAPFIILNIKRVYLLFIVSFFIYSFAVTGFLNTDYFGYRLLLGVLFMFLLGTLIHRSFTSKKELYAVLVIYFFIAALFLYVLLLKYKAPYNHETLVALLVGVPIIYILQLFKNRLAWYKNIDKFFGFLSYNVFLIHFPILWIVQLLNIKQTLHPTILGTILFSIFIHLLFEKRVYKRLFKRDFL